MNDPLIKNQVQFRQTTVPASTEKPLKGIVLQSKREAKQGNAARTPKVRVGSQHSRMPGPAQRPNMLKGNRTRRVNTTTFRKSS